REDFCREKNVPVSEGNDARLRHGAPDERLRVPQPERKADLRLRQLFRGLTAPWLLIPSPHGPSRLSNAGTAVPALPWTSISVRNAAGFSRWVVTGAIS